MRQVVFINSVAMAGVISMLARFSFMRLRSERELRFVAVVLAAIVLVCSGCGDGPAEKIVESLPFKGEKLRVAVPAGVQLSEYWDASLREWSAQTGAEVEIRECSVAEIIAAHQGGDKTSFAVQVFPLSAMPDLWAADTLAPISNPWLLEQQLDDYFPGIRELAGARGKVIAALPLNTPAYVLYYREDLLTAAGLSPPETWGDYEMLLERLAEWAPGMTAVEPWSPEFRTTTFLSRAAAWGTHPSHYSLLFDIDNGAPLIDSPAFQRAIASCRKSLERMPAKVWSMGPEECRRELLDGRAALAIAFETGRGNLPAVLRPQLVSGDLEKPVSDSEATGPVAVPDAAAGNRLINMIRLPGVKESYNLSRKSWEPVSGGKTQHMTVLGASGLAVGVSSRATGTTEAAAMSLLRQFVSDEQLNNPPPGAYGIVREAHTQLAVSWCGPELSTAEQNRYVNAMSISLRDSNIVLDLSVVGHTQFRSSLSARLTQALLSKTGTMIGQPPQAGTADSDAETATPDELAALSAAATDWQKTVDQLTSKVLRQSYRESVGLASSIVDMRRSP